MMKPQDCAMFYCEAHRKWLKHKGRAGKNKRCSPNFLSAVAAFQVL